METTTTGDKAIGEAGAKNGKSGPIGEAGGKKGKANAIGEAGAKPGTKAGAKAGDAKPEAPKPAAVHYKAGVQHAVTLIKRDELLCDQSKNTRSDWVDLSDPDPDFILLAISLRRDGLLHSVTVRKLPDGFKYEGKPQPGAIPGKVYKYETIAGYRRNMAHFPFETALSGKANVEMKGSEKRVDTIVLDADDTKIKFDGLDMVECKIVEVENAYDIAVIRGIENVHRKDLTGFEMAKLVWDTKQASIDAGLGSGGKSKGLELKQIGEDLHISRTHAANLWGTRRLIRPFMKAFENGSLGLKEAIRYAAMEKEEQQTAYEVWENRHGGDGGEGEEGAGGGGEKGKKSLSKAKIEGLAIDVEQAIEMKIAGKWVALKDDQRAAVRACLKFIIAPPERGELFKLEEEESDD